MILGIVALIVVVLIMFSLVSGAEDYNPKRKP